MSEGENVWRRPVQVGMRGPDYHDMLDALESAWQQALVEAQRRVRETGLPVIVERARIEIVPVGTARQRGVMSGVVIEMHGPMVDPQEPAAGGADENTECTG